MPVSCGGYDPKSSEAEEFYLKRHILQYLHYLSWLCIEEPTKLQYTSQIQLIDFSQTEEELTFK